MTRAFSSGVIFSVCILGGCSLASKPSTEVQAVQASLEDQAVPADQAQKIARSFETIQQISTRNKLCFDYTLGFSNLEFCPLAGSPSKKIVPNFAPELIEDLEKLGVSDVGRAQFTREVKIIAKEAKELKNFCFAGHFFKPEVAKTCQDYTGDFE
jgi:hypothetical protein